MTTTTRWWWVRHAPVEGGGVIYGQDDPAADCSDPAPFGWLAGVLPRNAVWIVTQLRRTRQTAEAIHARWPHGSEPALARPQVEAAFAEQHFGDWQGRSHAELAGIRNGAWHRFWLAPADTRPPGGESFTEVVSRVADAVVRLSAEHAGRDIVAVAHGGSIRAAVALALDLDPEKALALAVDTCSLTRLDHIAGGAGSHTADGARSWRVNQL
ncbi:MAG: histidine phosphatase family protein, partial [Kiloniellales bacterium]|nr:histidine phosphatase family protein [Kiloniellales bacterium]